jgi:hypothetical protein
LLGTEGIAIDEDCSGTQWFEDNSVVQCLWDIINQEFSNQTVVFGQDSVELTVYELTGITLESGASNFNLFINVVLQLGGTGTAVVGSIVKIKPHTLGSVSIYVDGSCSSF